MNILITGAAGFIGYHTCQRLLARGDTVVGLDNVNDYYDPTLKEARLSRLRESEAAAERFRFYRLDLADTAGMQRLFASESVDRVIHLAAQAGVRYSLDNPQAYVDSNVTGFLNVLEGCRHHSVEHLTYASTSSVYGANTHMPFTEHEPADHPLAIYGATKRANELMAHSYAHLFGLPCTGLRFFTVYGPWGRPDMALFLFTRKILAGEPIPVFNRGHHQRDFTFVEDIVEGVVRASDHIATGNPHWDSNRPDPPPAPPPGGCSTSATTSRCSCWTTFGCWSAAWGGRPRWRCCRYRPATCRTPGPAPTTCSRRWAISRPLRWKPACGGSWTGIGITTRSSAG